MKKVLLGILAAVALVVVVLAGALFVTFAGHRPILDGYQVAPGVKTVKDGFVSVFVVDVDAKHVALIDAGNDVQARPVLAALAARKLGPEAVTMILLTHGHPDHRAGCAAFPQATLAALGAEVSLIEGAVGPHGPLPRLFPVKPTGLKVGRILTDGETVHLGNVSIQVFAVPGHTAGSAAYFVNGALILGDAADSRTDGTMGGAKWIASDDVQRNRDSLKALAGRVDPQAVTTLAFSHSGPLLGAKPLLDFAAKP